MQQTLAMVVEAVHMMEIASVTAVSMQLIAQVNFLWIIQSSKYILKGVFSKPSGNCTNHGDCQCDKGFYAADCSGKLSLNYSIIKIFFEILNALLE